MNSRLVRPFLINSRLVEVCPGSAVMMMRTKRFCKEEEAEAFIIS